MSECVVEQVATSPPEAEFSNARSLGLAVDSTGTIYVADGARIIVMSNRGRLVRTVGRPGEGPGEFAYIANIQILPGDSLLAYDLALNRFTVFLPHSGSVAYTTNLSASSSIGSFDWLNKTSEGSLLVANTPAYRSSDNPEEDQERRLVLHLLEPDGRMKRDSVLTFRPDQFILLRRPEAVAFTPDPFGRRSVLERGPNDLIYHGWTDSLRIDVFSLHGERVSGFSALHKPVPVTDSDLTRALGSTRQMFHRALRETLPSDWPAFENFVVDDLGRIWIGLVTPTGEPTEWVAFTDSGTPICVVDLPERVELHLVRNGKAYGVQTNELDVPRVIVYAIEEPRDREGT